MEVCLIEEQQFSSGSRNHKRPRVDDDQGDGPETPTAKCRKHPSLYLEDGNVVLRCEDTLFRFYIGILSRKSEVFQDMFGLAPFQPTDSEKTVDGVPVVRLYDSAEDFAYLLSALLDYESLFLQKYIQYPRFSALLRLSMKYAMEGVRKVLIHSIQKHYPVEISDYERIMNEHGTAATAAFALPPHANEVLKLFWECDIKQCLPVAFYEATIRGVNSLSSSTPKVSLPPQILGPAIRALGSFHSKRVDHVRSTLDPIRDCDNCKTENLLTVEHTLLPTKNDLSLSPLRDSGLELRPGIARNLCGACAGEVTTGNTTFRHVFWAELPGMFGLPAWGELSKFVILK